jgi:Xaa-Pro aminopeptidase
VNGQVLAEIRRRLGKRGLGAYVAYTPSNVFYAAGFQSYFLMRWWRMRSPLSPAFYVISAALAFVTVLTMRETAGAPPHKTTGATDAT